MTAKTCRMRLSGTIAAHAQIELHIRCGDAFDSAVLRQLPLQEFDLVITNPPFVRYQGEGRDGATAAGVRSRLVDAAKTLLTDAADRQFWTALICGYSGQADLAIPSWLLSAMLVRPGGKLALVAPSTWRSRQYGDVVRYVLNRCFSEVEIVDDIDGAWFGGVQVRTSIVVAKKHIRSSVSVALTAQGNSRKDADSANQAVLLRGDSQSKWFAVLEGSQPTQEPVELPSSLQCFVGDRALAWVDLKACGWRVGQGLRTGCNGFFYVERVNETSSLNPALIQFGELLDDCRAIAPPEVVQTVIRRQSQLNGTLVPRRPSSSLLNLEGWFLPEDARRLPESVRKSVRILPRSLSAVIRKAAATSFDGRVAIPELTAVRPNARLVNGELSRCWYQLPRLARRHRPDLLVPRVNNLDLSVRLNRRPPLIVDANFSGLWRETGPWSEHAVIAYCASTWGQLSMERAGTPMGGGALKLEAVQLSRLALPKLNRTQLEQLSSIGRDLVGQGLAFTHDVNGFLAGVIGDARSNGARRKWLKSIEVALISAQTARRRD